MSEIENLIELGRQALDDADLLKDRGSLRAAQNRINNTSMYYIYGEWH